MHRRTFLKLIGVAVVAIPATTAIAKPKPRWICLTEAVPQLGQKFILIGITVRDDDFMIGGTVYETQRIELHPNGEDFVTIPISKDFKRRKHSCQDRWLYASFSENGIEQIKHKKWLRKDEKPSHLCHFKKHIGEHKICFRKDSHYWLAVDGDYPETLPPLPPKTGTARPPMTGTIRHRPPKTYLPGDRDRWFDYLYPDTWRIQ